MNLLIGTAVMTVIIFCLGIIISSRLKTLIYYLIIALIILMIAIILSYQGEIDYFIVDYFLPLIIPIIIYEIYYFIKTKQIENKTKNEKIILFQFQKIISLIGTLIIFQILILLLALKFVFKFDINIIYLIAFAIMFLVLIGMTIYFSNHRVEKIIIISQGKVYQYQISDKTYIISRSEFIEDETNRNATIYINRQEVHYVYLLDYFSPSDLFVPENFPYEKIIEKINKNTFSIIIIRIKAENILNIKRKFYKNLKK